MRDKIDNVSISVLIGVFMVVSLQFLVLYVGKMTYNYFLGVGIVALIELIVYMIFEILVNKYLKQEFKVIFRKSILSAFIVAGIEGTVIALFYIPYGIMCFFTMSIILGGVIALRLLLLIVAFFGKKVFGCSLASSDKDLH